MLKQCRAIRVGVERMGKQLLITSEILNKMEYELWEVAEDKYFFDYDSYEIVAKESATDNAAEGAYLIPLVHVSQVEVMKAFLVDHNDRTITNAFKDLSDKDIWSRFWNEFDDDGNRSGRWKEFEDKYLRKTIENWCDENGIAYRMET